MRMKIVISTMERLDSGERRSEIWNGEMDILEDGEYITKISILGEGMEHPICEIPFSPMTGYWQWIPPLVDDDILEERENKIVENTNELMKNDDAHYPPEGFIMYDKHEILICDDANCLHTEDECWEEWNAYEAENE